MSGRPPGATLDDVVAELRAIRQLLEAAARPSCSLSRSDRATLARLLPPIAGVFGSELFLVRDLFDSDAPALRLVLSGLTTNQVGRLFRRGEWQAIDGYLVQSEGSELNTVLWRVVQYGVVGDRSLTVPPRHRRGEL